LLIQVSNILLSAPRAPVGAGEEECLPVDRRSAPARWRRRRSDPAASTSELAGFWRLTEGWRAHSSERIRIGDNRAGGIAHHLAALDPQSEGGRTRLISDEDIEFIVATATTRPGRLGCPFTCWSMRKLSVSS
jgi:hypothetical protein